MTEGEHINDYTALDYLYQSLPIDRLAEIDKHMNSCDACASVIREAAHFELIWENMDSNKMAALRTVSIVKRALLNKSEISEEPQIKDKVRAWIRKWGHRGEAAVRVLMDTVNMKSMFIESGLEEFLIRDFPADSKTVRPVEFGGEDAFRRGAVIIDGATYDGTVFSDAETGSIDVQLIIADGDREPSVSALIGIDNLEAQIKQFSYDEDDDSFTCSFKVCDSGDYIMLIMPFSDD